MRHPLLQRLLLAIALFALIGGHRGVIQCVAWGKMIYERTGERTFSEALASTFSGEEPCNICVAIKESRDSEKDSPVPIPSVKIYLAPVSTDVFVPARIPLLAEYPEPDARFRSATAAPPCPPPPELA